MVTTSIHTEKIAIDMTRWGLLQTRSQQCALVMVHKNCLFIYLPEIAETQYEHTATINRLTAEFFSMEVPLNLWIP